MGWNCHLLDKNGSSEYHIVGIIKLRTPRFTRSMAGVSIMISKHMMRPNVTLKSVVNVEWSAMTVCDVALSPNKLYFR